MKYENAICYSFSLLFFFYLSTLSSLTFKDEGTKVMTRRCIYASSRPDVDVKKLSVLLSTWLISQEINKGKKKTLEKILV